MRSFGERPYIAHSKDLDPLDPAKTQIIQRWNLAGDQLGSRLVGSCGGYVPNAVAVDATSHDVLVGGMLLGTTDFGTGPVSTRGGPDGFVLDIKP